MTIRTKEPDVPSELPAAKLYLDDVIEIVELFSHALPLHQDKFGGVPPLEIGFEVGQKQCDTLDELPKIARVTNNFEIRATREHSEISLHANDHHAMWVWYGLDGETAWSTARKLQSIFKQRKRFLRNRLRNFVWAALLVAFAPVSLLIRNPKVGILLFVGLLLLIAGMAAASRGHTIVILRYRSEKLADKEERTKQTARIILTAILSVLGTLLATYLIRRIWF